MRSTELHYRLPGELVARYPAPEREQARLLSVGERGLSHHRFSELSALLPARALLVLNDTRVIPARLLGRKRASGGNVEVLLVRRIEGSSWSAMVRSSRPLRAGAVVEVGRLAIEVEEVVDGLHRVRLDAPAGESADALIDELGHVPLPPYLGRPDEAADRERYQTVYARVPGAVAAPTAGLHFTSALLEELMQKGVELARLTLHVGPGTFRPITAAELADHQMHSEAFEVPEATAAAIAAARSRGAPVVAVGTTVVRALESAADGSGLVRAMRGEAQLFIQPGYRFRVVDALVTNFHLPGSTLLALVYAFGGIERMRAAYLAAIEHRYRFYSYGDAMWVTPAEDRA